MKLKLSSVLIAFILISFGLLVGCNGNSSQSNNSQLSNYHFEETAFRGDSLSVSSSSDKPLSAHLLVNETYCKATACKCIQYLASREYDEVLSILKTNYNIDLRLTYCTEEDSIGQLLKTGKYDGVICKPWFAYMLMPVTDMNFARVADVLDPFDEGLLRGIFIVKKESSLLNADDINGKIIAIGQETSYEKYHLAMKSLDERSIKPAKFIQKGSCTECIDLLIDDQVDVACISDYALVASCAVDFAEEDAFRVLLKTDSIPLCSVIIDLNKVDESSASRLQHALLNLSQNKLPMSFASKGFVTPKSWIPTVYKKLN